MMINGPFVYYPSGYLIAFIICIVFPLIYISGVTFRYLFTQLCQILRQTFRFIVFGRLLSTADDQSISENERQRRNRSSSEMNNDEDRSSDNDDEDDDNDDDTVETDN